jgi:predicted  nucleic acid-binding Zn-ribbon protein
MDVAVLVNLMVETAGLEEELEALRAVRARRRRRLDLISLGYEVDRESADREAGERDAAAAASRGRQGRLGEVEDRLARKRDQMIGVTDRRQYRALQEEIAGLERERDRLETAELEYLEAESLPRPARKPAAPAEAGEIAALEADEEKAARAETEIREELVRLADLVPSPQRRHLLRVRRQLGRAVVRVEGRACGGCGGQLPQQQALDAARGRTLVRCPSCARFVVRHSYR